MLVLTCKTITKVFTVNYKTKGKYNIMTKFLIGCDPELFVENEKGVIVSAHGLIPGTKEAPHKVDKGAVQVDGMAVELNIDPVSSFKDESFANRVFHVARQLHAMLPDGYKLVPKAYHDFGEEYMKTQPDEAKQLGCEPDFGAWQEGEENKAPDEAVTFRTAAGHVHIGWGKDIPADHPDHIAVCCKIVKSLDLYLGLASIIMDPCPNRRELYGRAGAFRPKTYGVEYRTPSNTWLQNYSSRKLISHLVNKSITSVQRGINPQQKFSMYAGAEHKDKTIEDVINNNDFAAALSFTKSRVGPFRPSNTAYTAKNKPMNLQNRNETYQMGIY